MRHRIQRIHFTGIGGIGMSAIAELLHNQGFFVQGSDVGKSRNTERLTELGIPLWIGHHEGHIQGAEVVVVSSAIDECNPEIKRARREGIPVIPRAEMLAELMRMKHGIAIAGSHGKTTITSMIAHGMQAADLDPTYAIGGRLVACGNNARLGSSPYLVAEADESDGSFLHLSPMIAVVSNIDPEHLDHYGDFEHLLDAFRQFIQRVPFYGRVILHHEHPHVASLRDGLCRPLCTYGSSPQADIHLLHCQAKEHGQIFSVGRFQKDNLGEFYLPMPGKHNAENALAAIAVLLDLGVELEAIRLALASFSGIQRRFQTSNIGAGVLVDDYAHHPCEINATLEAAKQCWPKKHIVTLFQPHRYSRTRDLMQDFIHCFQQSHELGLLPIYAASEEPIDGISSDSLLAGLRTRSHRQAFLVDDLAAAFDYAQHALQQGHLVILMGAGSIGQVAERLRQQAS